MGAITTKDKPQNKQYRKSIISITNSRGVVLVCTGSQDININDIIVLKYKKNGKLKM